ncbi:trypsin-like serine peptidase [Kineococcus rhizosphaerae]|uniref:V8-like Glu-specific endopeptidase n=1 Tax=Kineococcus rhizosphaerae TaxID=559628 RepID=A0A2T0RBQ9_9ACTN|nr:trypsin-like serine protease [Kineococcus rhizosphaerae]PRY18577.1 V8-like Glu-specific endopeptidase [Kineococcus rhizosphaerae]
MRRLVSATSAGALALASAAFTITGAVSASAVPVTATGSSGSSASLLSTADASAQQAALDYWTPERMAQATPVDRVVPARARAGTASSTTSGTTPATTSDATSAPSTHRSTLATGAAPAMTRQTRSAADVVTGASVSRATTWTGTAVPTVGRLYFTQGRGKYECSASSVASPRGNVVVTAGHCVTEGGLASTNVVFVPGLTPTSEPNGRFSVTKLFTTAQWKNGDQASAAALNYDVGFAVVATGTNGKSLRDTVGAYDVEFSDALGQVTVLGYPGQGPTADGNTLQFCSGLQFVDNGDDATTDHATQCDLAGGSSGGPWLRGFDAARRTGTVTSVVSFSYDDGSGILYGPRFGDVVQAVYTETLAAS